MPSMDEILSQLTPEDVPDAIDYDAPEPGTAPPAVMPGTYDFIFRLPEDEALRFDLAQPQNGNNKRTLKMIYEADVIDPTQTDPVRLRYQRVSSYKSDKMKNSQMGDLVRSLNIRLSTDTPGFQDFMAAFTQADGRARGNADIIWRRYCKSCDCTVSTAPRKGKKPESAWPRAADGKPELDCPCPKCGVRAYGNAEISRFHMPAKEAHA